MEQKNTQYQVKRFRDILVAEKPKGILLVRPMEGPASYQYSFNQEKAAKCLCENLGIQYVTVPPLFFSEAFPNLRQSEGEQIRKYLFEGIKSELDMGIFFHSCLCCSPNIARNVIRNLDEIFGQSKVYLINPTPESQLGYARGYEYPNLDERLITI